MKPWNVWMLVLVFSALIGAGYAQEVEKVDINNASLQHLESLPGVGLGLAKRILDFRSKNGPFKRIEELMNVKGIGEKKFLKLRDRIRVAIGGA